MELTPQEGQLYYWLYQGRKAHSSGALAKWWLQCPTTAPALLLNQQAQQALWTHPDGRSITIPPTELTGPGEYLPQAVAEAFALPSDLTYHWLLIDTDTYGCLPQEAWLQPHRTAIEELLPDFSTRMAHELLTELQLESLLDLMRDAVLLEDANRNISYVNQAFCDLFSIPLPPKELVGWDCEQSLQQAKTLFIEPDAFIERIHEVLRQGREVRNDRLHMTSGQVLDRDYRPLSSKGKPRGHLWVYRDISQLIKQEQLRQQSERKYQRVLENLDVGILEVDNQGLITKAFDKFCTLTGYTAEELMGRDPFEVFDSPQMRERKALFDEQVKERHAGKSSVYEMPLRKKNGDIIWVQISGTPLYNNRHELIGSLGLHIDVTSRKQKEAELTQAKEVAEIANQAKEQFMSSLSHEMLTPMNGIMGFVNLLSESPDLSTSDRYYLESIQNAADNLLVLLEDLLDFSRIQGTKLKINKRVFNVSRSIHNFCSIFNNELERQRNTLHIEVDPALPYKLSGDPLRIGQLVKHLTSNAIKFTRNGDIYVRLHELNRTAEQVQVMLEVEDTGTGIPPEEHERIFERFYRAERFTDHLTSGTGIGLSIVKQIVDQMGGTISLDSTPGAGSRFQIQLTLDIADDQKISRLLQQHGTALSQLQVLVAEDNHINQLLIEENLNNWKIPFTLVDNGEAVVEALQTNSYDLILMDIQMPKMGGIDATRLIRQSKAGYQNIPIIALTAYALAEDEQRCLNAGMNDYVSKPFHPYQLLVKLIQAGLQKKVERIKLQPTEDEEAAPTEKPSLQHIDLSYLKAFSRGNKKLEKKLIRSMVEQEKEVLIDVQTYLTVNDWKGLFRLMHRLKPNIELLGMVNIIDLTKELTEDLRHEENTAEAPAKLETFQQGFSAAIQELKMLTAKGATDL